jgi:hypothetical protein
VNDPDNGALKFFEKVKLGLVRHERAHVMTKMTAHFCHDKNVNWKGG